VTLPALTRMPRAGAPPIALASLAAVAVAASGFVAPGSLLPPVAALAGAAAAGGLAALALGPIRRPALAATLPPLAILVALLAGMAAGLASVPPAPLAAIGAPELALRSLAGALALGVLAALCPFPALARGLAGAAVGAPGLLALVWLLFAIVPRTSGGAQGLAVAGLFVAYLLILGLWGAYLRRTRDLEQVHAALGRAAVRSVQGAPVAERQRTFELLDGWLDPLGEARARARSLATSASGEPRQAALTGLLEAVAPTGGALASRAREDLEAVAPVVPEARIALAADDLARGSADPAEERVAATEREMLADPRLARLADPLEEFLATHEDEPALEGHRERLDAVRIVAEFAAAQEEAARPEALQRAYLALGERGAPLSDEARSALEMLASRRPEAEILLAEDSARRDLPIQTLLAIGRGLRPAPDTAWIPREALLAWDRHRAVATPPALAELWSIGRARGPDRHAAGAILALAALETGLSNELRDAAVAALREDADAAVLLALDALRASRVEPGAIGLLARTPLLPPALLDERVLPRLRSLAAEALAGRTLFHHDDRRPQLLEVLDAPATSIYGGRATSWTWMRGSAPIRMAVVGQAPGAVGSRVSLIVNHLAHERSCDADLVLADVAFFDLSAELPRREPPWTAEQGLGRILGLADRLGVTAEIGEPLRGAFGQQLLQEMTREPLRPTPARTREALARAEREMGFIANQMAEAAPYDRTHGALRRGESVPTAASFPVLTPYRRDGRPLRVRVPLAALGGDEYDYVVEEYRAAVLSDIRAEWERRRLVYEDWVRRGVALYHELQGELDRDGPEALATRPISITARINIEQATVEELDPPDMTMALRRLEELPLQLLYGLAFWAVAEHQLEHLASPAEFTPLWARSCLVDALLRDRPLPNASRRLRAAHENWRAAARPLALLALDEALRGQGCSLDAIAVENTVFRAAGVGDGALELELLHIFDPGHDLAPALMNGVTLYQPRWGARRRTLMAAEEAQRSAIESIERALQQETLSSAKLRALAWDSGAALDRLLATVIRPLQSAGLEREMQRAMRLAASAENPTAVLQLRLQEGPAALGRLAGDEGRSPGGVPDLLAFELFVAGNVARDWARKVAQGGAPRPELVTAKGAVAVARMGVWETVRQIVEDGPRSRSVTLLLGANPRNHVPPNVDLGGEQLWLSAARLRETYALLRRRDASYAERCLAGEGFPRRSRQYLRRAVPTRFQGQLRVGYHVADGDIGLAVGLAALEGAAATDVAGIVAALERLRAVAIPEPLTRQIGRREELLAALDGFVERGVPLAEATARLRNTGLEALEAARVAYERAAVIDRGGDAWLRLARLHWLAGEYRQALLTLVGPPPAAERAACQLPFELAARLAGAELQIERGDQEWTGPHGVTAEAATDGGLLALAFRVGDGLVGSCEVGGLTPADASLLAQLFVMHLPEELRGGGGETFEEWLQLVAVPNLGQRGALARAASGDHGAALLAAMAYFGVPPALGAPPGAQPGWRPEEWLDHEVVTAISWLTQTAHAA
jgi:hypothetical protein